MCFMIYIFAHKQEILKFSRNLTPLKIELQGTQTYENVGNYHLMGDGSDQFNRISYGICIKSNRVKPIFSIFAKSLEDLRPP